MPVTVRGQQFYTKAEVSAMTPQAKIDDCWETYNLTLLNGYTNGWNQNAFHVNKYTGLVTGTIGLGGMASATSWTYATNANLGTHSALMIKYPGQFEYGYATTSATDSVNANYCNINTNINTNGEFTLQGQPIAVANRPMFQSIIENFAYIGSKYGHITDTDVKPVYMQEGTFYDTNSAELINGRAWLRTKLTLPTGYTTNSYVYIYKNLWSGECIVQYSLYPSTKGTTPTIALPERFRMVKRNNAYPTAYIPIRYREGVGTTPASSTANHNLWMCISSTISFNAPTLTWMTGSYYYQGNPEYRAQANSSETVIGLWTPDRPGNAVPSANNNCWKTGYDENTVNLDNYWDTNYYKARSNPQSWTSYNKRTGMVYAYFDFTTVGTTLPNTLMRATQIWDAEYLPSHRYNKTAGTSQKLYVGVNGYLQFSSTTTAFPREEYGANLYIGTCTALGTAPTENRVWAYGTPAVTKPVASNLSCYSAYYLGGSNANVRA